MAILPNSRSGLQLETHRMSVSSISVTVCIVSHESAMDLPACLESVAAVEHRPLELIIVDCASRDGSMEVARRAAPSELPMELISLAENVGYARAMNRALSHTQAPWVLALNPDARLSSDYVSQLLARVERHPDLRIGALTGRLTRPQSEDAPGRLDACGMFLSLTWRHLDRGSGQPDRGQWSASAERVFGATGAAALYRREAIDDAAIDGDLFASEFHSFREDAELCFRLRERGWEVVYEPTATAEHRRRSLPERRRSLPAEINYHSLKNRYLLRAYHQDLANLFITFIPTVLRDSAVLAYVLMLERSSLPAYSWLWRNRRRIFARRRRIQGRRTSGSWGLNQWFVRRSLPL